MLTKVMLQARFHDLNELIGHSIYISVTVLTDSGEKQFCLLEFNSWWVFLSFNPCYDWATIQSCRPHLALIYTGMNQE